MDGERWRRRARARVRGERGREYNIGSISEKEMQMYPYLFICGTNSGQKLYEGTGDGIEVIRACAELRTSLNFP